MIDLNIVRLSLSKSVLLILDALLKLTRLRQAANDMFTKRLKNNFLQN